MPGGPEYPVLGGVKHKLGAGPTFSGQGAGGEIDVGFIPPATVVYALTLTPIVSAIVSQETAEILLGGANTNALLSQETVEVLHANAGSTAAVSQATVEVLIQVIEEVDLPFISSNTVVYALTLTPQISLPFIPSHTVVYGIFSLFTNVNGFGPGNGGEVTLIRLAPHGASVTATLDSSITNVSSNIRLTGDSGLPQTVPFVITIDSETFYVSYSSTGFYWIIARAVSNTTRADHVVGAPATWSDSYDMAILSTNTIAGSFTANINSTGSVTYPGWLICFDSSQAYLSGARYPMHVTSVLGVFDAGAGSSGSNRCDAAQPNAISTAIGTSDNCPAALSNPSRIATTIAIGDVALVRYTNPEGVVLDLGPRSAAFQSWFGLKRVDTTDHDVTLTNPNGIVVDTTGTYDTFTGSVNGEFHNPSSIGIAPSTGLPTVSAVPYTTVTLPGVDRFFTYGPPGYNETGWPICALAVRQGTRRVPLWESYDWHNFNYVYCGFGTDDTYCQILINRNGMTGALSSITLPGPQDIAGPDAVWDDGTYYFGASWYVAIFGTPYLVIGPGLGGSLSPGGAPGDNSFLPGVTFSGGGTPTVTTPGFPPVEGGSGGNIPPPGGLHIWHRPWKIS